MASDINFNTFNLKSIHILVGIVILLFSCKKENACDCLKSTGEIITEKRNLECFNHIILNDKINLYVHPNSDTNIVEIKAGENLTHMIKTEVSDSTVFISNDNKCNWVRSFKNAIDIHLYAKEIKIIDLEGSGSIFFMDTLYSDYFQIDIRNASGSVNLLLNCREVFLGNHSGVADFTAAGDVKTAFLPHTSNAPVDCKSLQCIQIYGRNHSKCNTHVNVKRLLSMDIEYLGNIYYYGSPNTIHTKNTGQGKLIKAD